MTLHSLQNALRDMAIYREGGIRLKLRLGSGLGPTVSGRVGFRVRVMY